MGATYNVHGVRFRKEPRAGQLAVFNQVLGRDSLNVKLPTGYGKTFTACGAYSILKHHGAVDRALFIFPRVAQLDQFLDSGHVDLADAGVQGSHTICDVYYYKWRALHLASEPSPERRVQIFAVSIQSLSDSRSIAPTIIEKLLSEGDWMIVVDEYHHYGFDKAWGKTILGLPRRYLMPMSATPDRKGNDSAFGEPEVEVLYSDAVSEGAVKQLVCHAYRYKVEAIINDRSDIVTYTTDELTELAGGDSPEAIEAMLIQRKMRWSPKYTEPLLSVPLERMIQATLDDGVRRQAVVFAMCVSHAKIVCEQISAYFGNALSVDWVGTGKDGRTDDENREIIRRFCPPKDDQGNRNHELDVLVNVGMAGEGMDSIAVTEIIFLKQTRINNQTLQGIGRGGRKYRVMTCHVNMDSSGEIPQQGFLGREIEHAMDYEQPSGEPPSPGTDDDIEPGIDGLIALPPEPDVEIWNMELQDIDSGDPIAHTAAKMLEGMGREGVLNTDINYAELAADLSHPKWGPVLDWCKKYLLKRSEGLNEKAVLEEKRKRLDMKSGTLARNIAILLARAHDSRPDNKLIGITKKRVNERKKQLFGEVIADLRVIERHIKWVDDTNAEILETKEVPDWVS